MTLSKLSLRNAKRQARDYLVYFVTIVMAAALIYAFNGLVFSEEIRTLSSMMESMPLVIVLTSIVVVCIIGWLVQYTISFMLVRRGRELGTYILTGLENRQVARMFFMENLIVGGIALVLGTLLGNLLFQALRAVLLALFRAPYTFRFSFSFQAVGLTVIYFSMVYLFALLRSRQRIRTMKIHDLIYFDHQNEEEVIKKSRIRRKIFIFSLLFGLAGTILLILRNLRMRPWRFNELQKSLEGISQKVLTESLRSMEADGIIVRTVYAEVPPRVEYSLSELGETMRPILDAMEQWGNNYKSTFH